jgi:hypothetical protein
MKIWKFRPEFTNHDRNIATINHIFEHYTPNINVRIERDISWTGTPRVCECAEYSGVPY